MNFYDEQYYDKKIKEYQVMIIALFVFVIFSLFFALVANERINDIENKISGNCIYINNEYYCKD